MNLEQARCDLNRALIFARADHASQARHLQVARQLLIDKGAAALAMEPKAGLSIAEVIRIAITAPAGPDRRSFAVLLVDALGVDELLRVRSSRGDLGRDICIFVESALHDVLRRARYPFIGSAYDKVSFLERSRSVIDQHLQPLELTFPLWLSGMDAGTTG